MRLEVNVTYSCNAVCEHCNRAVGLAKFGPTNVTAEQMGRMVDDLIARKIRVRRLTLAGGEPLVNPHLQGILDHAARLPGLKNGRLLTNDVKRDGPRADLKLPPMFRWVPAPLDLDTGKTQHVPFFISPKDHGLDAHYGNCTVRGYCGKGFDAFGYSMCGIAGTLGRLLGINPYSKTPIVQERRPEVLKICQHCPYGIDGRPAKYDLYRRVAKGELTAISPVYRDGLKRHRKEPMELEKW